MNRRQEMENDLALLIFRRRVCENLLAGVPNDRCLEEQLVKIDVFQLDNDGDVQGLLPGLAPAAGGPPRGRLEDLAEGGGDLDFSRRLSERENRSLIDFPGGQPISASFNPGAAEKTQRVCQIRRDTGCLLDSRCCLGTPQEIGFATLTEMANL